MKENFYLGEEYFLFKFLAESSTMSNDQWSMVHETLHAYNHFWICIFDCV